MTVAELRTPGARNAKPLTSSRPAPRCVPQPVRASASAPRKPSLTWALLVANLRYWPTVAPLVHRELCHWRVQAETIPDRDLRALALAKLADEHFNAQVASTLATLAPLRHRATVTRAIVAYQVIYDYLDGLTEQSVPQHLHSNLCLYRAFTDAVAGAESNVDYYDCHPQQGDGGYLRTLSHTVKDNVARLPAVTGIRESAYLSARRCAEAQARVHAAGAGDPSVLIAWAEEQAGGTSLGWPEWLAGAMSCVLSVHALIAAAADRATVPQHAVALDDAYLPIAGLSTMLDGLVDWRSDRATGQTSWLLSHCQDHAHLIRLLRRTATAAATRARTLPHAPHHVMTMTGVVAYYASSPAAAEPHARPAVEHMRRALGTTLTQTLAVMRAWRALKRISGSLPFTLTSSSESQ